MAARKLPPHYKREALEYAKRLKARAAQHHEHRARWGWSDTCQHGTYIGSPYGPDYMCGTCEDGDTVYEVALRWAWIDYAAAREAARNRLYARVCDAFFGEDDTVQRGLLDHHDLRTLLNAVNTIVARP